MQIPDAFMISGTGRDFGHPHDFMAVSLNRVRKIMILPVLHQGRINADMGNTDPAVIFNGSEKSR
jgi:hypothetical protein